MLENSLNLIAGLSDDLPYPHQFLAVHAMSLVTEKMTYASQLASTNICQVASSCWSRANSAGFGLSRWEVAPSSSNGEPIEENFHLPRYILPDRHARPDKGIPDKCRVGYSASRSYRLRGHHSLFCISWKQIRGRLLRQNEPLNADCIWELRLLLLNFELITWFARCQITIGEQCFILALLQNSHKSSGQNETLSPCVKRPITIEYLKEHAELAILSIWKNEGGIYRQTE